MTRQRMTHTWATVLQDFMVDFSGKVNQFVVVLRDSIPLFDLLCRSVTGFDERQEFSFILRPHRNGQQQHTYSD